MKTFIRSAMKKYLEQATLVEIKASEMWMYIKECHPDVEQTKYRPSILKSLWCSMNQQFNNKFTLIYGLQFLSFIAI